MEDAEVYDIAADESSSRQHQIMQTDDSNEMVNDFLRKITKHDKLLSFDESSYNHNRFRKKNKDSTLRSELNKKEQDDVEATLSDENDESIFYEASVTNTYSKNPETNE